MINKLCCIGLIPFLYIYLLKNSYISLAIFINGILFHSSYKTKYNKFLKYYDIFMNLIFTIYVNTYTKWQNQTFIITIFSCLSFIIENSYFGYDFLNDYIHIILVQFLLSIGLYKYYD